MTFNWEHFTNNFLISKFLFILIILAGTIIAFNGLVYSSFHATLNGTVLIILGITLYLLFNPHILHAGLIIQSKKKKKK